MNTSIPLALWDVHLVIYTEESFCLANHGQVSITSFTSSSSLSLGCIGMKDFLPLLEVLSDTPVLPLGGILCELVSETFTAEQGSHCAVCKPSDWIQLPGVVCKE